MLKILFIEYYQKYPHLIFDLYFHNRLINKTHCKRPYPCFWEIYLYFLVLKGDTYFPFKLPIFVIVISIKWLIVKKLGLEKQTSNNRCSLLGIFTKKVFVNGFSRLYILVFDKNMVKNNFYRKLPKIPPIHDRLINKTHC